MVHIYNGTLLSHKKEQNNAICSDMDGPRDYHAKWCQTGKDKGNMRSLICGVWKNDTNGLIYKIETDSQTSKTNLWLPKGKGEGKDGSGVWDWHMHTIINGSRIAQGSLCNILW